MDYELDSSEEYQARECKSTVSDSEKEECCSGCGYNNFCWGTETVFTHHAKDDAEFVEKIRESIITGSREYGNTGLVEGVETIEE